ncbi:hypothetical protein [Roseibium suaedae]|uniref:Uncharacterized protein n=1 Tax=Roseibium suaedae TaxID=735517 RepID=A0A1M7MJI5_9HYPH|nr:hypothetical protein [Roseibium suaedae]SHM91120.1 hypothetical protein SAMN05444272_3436 [Roseibium suaedae]
MQERLPDGMEMRKRSWLAGLALVFAGYCLAVIAATFVCFTVFQTVALARDLMAGGEPFYFDLEGYFLGAVITFGTAWPGFLLSIGTSAAFKIRSLLYFAITGVGTAMLAVPFLVTVSGANSLYDELLLSSPAVYLGGFAGGILYGLFARRVHLV